ncbi:hypothetical protein [Parvularcula sp. LCG005]|uniref:hypothetical protein n=1 Tax=Parvularcula sp. LCG005 TaxID=3078805 RepID=UPI002942493D|nr:hypothetical protein [Parvularcula sp. LCG005]WOI53224.1 hypothetical protein RUI03_13840 [Parvularcula sp. LCG005]
MREVIFLVMSLFVVGCDARTTGWDAMIDSDRPLSIDWDAAKSDFLSQSDYSEYSRQIRELGGSVTPGEADELLNFANLTADELPEILKAGGVSVNFSQSQIGMLEYHYGHSLNTEYDERMQIAYDRHSKPILNALKKKYGAPDAIGEFDQSAESGFVSTDDAQPSCSAWLEGNVAIVFCNPRRIMIDGIEMSLSFIRLDRVPFSATLKQQISGTNQP